MSEWFVSSAAPAEWLLRRPLSAATGTTRRPLKQCRMEGKAALITGAASGIGKDLALQLARRGVRLTLADVDGAAAEQVAAVIRAAGGTAQAVRCDVADPTQHLAAFRLHQQRYGQLDYALLNAGGLARMALCPAASLLCSWYTWQRPRLAPCTAAGIGERGDLVWSQGSRWQQTLDVDLRAVMEGVRFAARAMLTGSPENGGSAGASGASRGARGEGVIMITASAGGTFPMPLRCGGSGAATAWVAGWQPRVGRHPPEAVALHAPAPAPHRSFTSNPPSTAAPCMRRQRPAASS